MKVLIETRVWLCRMARSVPSAWRYDRLFRGSVVGAGVALTFFTLRVAGPFHSRVQVPPQGPSLPASTAPTYTSAAQALPEPALPAEVPKIAPSRSLNGVTIIPTPPDRFGTAPSPNRK
jgi:hypothetical protein